MKISGLGAGGRTVRVEVGGGSAGGRLDLETSSLATARPAPDLCQLCWCNGLSFWLGLPGDELRPGSGHPLTDDLAAWLRRVRMRVFFDTPLSRAGRRGDDMPTTDDRQLDANGTGGNSPPAHHHSVPTPAPGHAHTTERGDIFVVGDASLWEVVQLVHGREYCGTTDEAIVEMFRAACAVPLERTHIVAMPDVDDRPMPGTPTLDWASVERVDAGASGAFMATVWWSPAGDLHDMLQALEHAASGWTDRMTEFEVHAAKRRLRLAADALDPWDDRAAQVYLDTPGDLPAVGLLPAAFDVLNDFICGRSNVAPSDLVGTLAAAQERSRAQNKALRRVGRPRS